MALTACACALIVVGTGTHRVIFRPGCAADATSAVPDGTASGIAAIKVPIRRAAFGRCGRVRIRVFRSSVAVFAQQSAHGLKVGEHLAQQIRLACGG